MANNAQPDVLPDFATLITLLNQTQLQRDNPALYNILKLLIQQDLNNQNVIVNTTIPTAIAAIPSTPSIIKRVEIPVAAISANFFGRSTTPLTLVAGESGVTHVPLACYMYSKITGAGGSYTNGATTWNLHYVNQFGTLPWGTGTNLAWATAVGGGLIARAFIVFSINLAANNITNAIFTAIGKPLLLVSGADVSGGSNGVAGLTLLYTDTSNNIY